MNTNKYTQVELLEIMQKYNSLDRQVIKYNLKEVKKKHNFQNADIISKFDYKEEKVRGWFNKANPTIPTFEDSLKLAVSFDFDMRELIK